MDMKKEKGTTGNQGIVNDSNEKIEEETDGGYKVTEEKLLKAAEKRDMDEVTKYLDHGADVNYCDKYGTSLHWTAAQGDLHMTRFLLEQGSDMNIKNKWGEGLLHRAIDGNLETLQLLLEQGMDTNMQTEDKTTGLHAALYRGKTDMVQLLLKSGADVNLQDKLKFDPLYDVLCNSNVEFAKYLIYEGAIVNESNLRGMVDTNDIPSDDILALCDIFIEAGYRISNNTVGHNGQGKYLNMEEINNHIYHRQQQIVTLRSLCRIRIRNELIQTTNGCSIRTAVCKLPLPKLLKNYIMFEQ
ncbi:putative ankyrin repeat protein RF_0381 isoform X2 [Mytilus edulis]|uniref:putative ankyrin repeat protein RF_0381 isoform X2 n=1 Tax=Mytilus edulis TaxID=6550 RepID=UPI0039F04C77